MFMEFLLETTAIQSFKVKLPFFVRSCPPWARASRRTERAERCWEPLFLYPLAEKVCDRPLSLYPLADKGLGPVGGPYRSTLWPFRRLATYPSYPYRVGPLVVVLFPSFQA